MKHKVVRIALFITQLIVGLNALVAGILFITGVPFMPLDVLKGTPFSSFLIPGLLLAIAVGGSTLAGAALLFWGRELGVLVSLAGGCITLGWIVVETFIVPFSFLQPAILAFSLLMIALAAFLWLTEFRAEHVPTRRISHA